MSSLRQLGSGFLYALFSIVLVVGGLSLAMAEGGLNSTAPAPTGQPGSTVVALSASPVSTLSSTLSSSQATSQTSTAVISTATAGPSPASQAAVLTATLLPPMATIYYASPYPTATGYYASPYPTSTRSAYKTSVPCGPYSGWVLAYTVQPGDTLYHIATQYRTTVNAVQIANCKPTTVIFPGERLWVPNVPTVTPGATYIPPYFTSTAVPTEPLTLTPIPSFTETAVPTDTTVPNP